MVTMVIQLDGQHVGQQLEIKNLKYLRKNKLYNNCIIYFICYNGYEMSIGGLLWTVINYIKIIIITVVVIFIGYRSFVLCIILFLETKELFSY